MAQQGFIMMNHFHFFFVYLKWAGLWKCWKFLLSHSWEGAPAPQHFMLIMISWKMGLLSSTKNRAKISTHREFQMCIQWCDHTLITQYGIQKVNTRTWQLSEWKEKVCIAPKDGPLLEVSLKCLILSLYEFHFIFSFCEWYFKAEFSFASAFCHSKFQEFEAY